MNVKVLITLLIAFSACSKAQVVSRWFSTRVNHFYPFLEPVFDLRYFVNGEHYVPGGPIYIYLALGAATESILTEGTMFEIARDTGGILFSLEHRFFGESRPTEDTSVENLSYLTIEQSIADIGEFIDFVKKNYNGAQNSRVVLWGRGYGGSLAVWTRHKYHHNVNGVWASSAFLDAIPDSLDIIVNTGETIRSIGGPECYQVIEDAIRLIDDAVRFKNMSYVENRFRLCERVDLDIEEEISRLFYQLASQTALNFLSSATYSAVEDMCSTIRGLNTPNDPPENAIDAFARWYADDFRGDVECLDYSYRKYIEDHTRIEWDAEQNINGGRPNFWIRCIGYGQFIVSENGDGHPFGWRFPFSFMRRWCADTFTKDL